MSCELTAVALSYLLAIFTWFRFCAPVVYDYEANNKRVLSAFCGCCVNDYCQQ